MFHKEILSAKLLKRRSPCPVQPLLCCLCDAFTSVLRTLIQHLKTDGAPEDMWASMGDIAESTGSKDTTCAGCVQHATPGHEKENARGRAQGSDEGPDERKELHSSQGSPERGAVGFPTYHCHSQGLWYRCNNSNLRTIRSTRDLRSALCLNQKSMLCNACTHVRHGKTLWGFHSGILTGASWDKRYEAATHSSRQTAQEQRSGF